MAKASPEEIDRAIELAHLFQATCDRRAFEPGHWPPTGDPFDETEPHDLEAFYEECKRLAPGLMRVAFGYQVLVDNACDPDADTLEWKPGLFEQNSQARSQAERS